jgi:hypothetical protein
MIDTFGQDDISQVLNGDKWENVIRITNDVDLVPEFSKVKEIIEVIKQTLKWHSE